MKNYTIISIFLITIVLSFTACDKKNDSKISTVCVSKTEKIVSLNYDEIKKEIQKLQNEMNDPCSVSCCELYVETVINNGSNVLNLPAGSMAGEYVTAEDAKIIASYVMTLSGREPTYREYIQEGNLYYNGNCGGCHGDDGKGLKGSYPDLTLKELKGVKIHKKNRIKTLQEMLEK